MLQQAQKKERKELSSCNVDDHIVITINDDENEWNMKQKANSKSSKTTKIIKGAIISFVVGVVLLAASFYVSDNYTSRKLQMKEISLVNANDNKLYYDYGGASQLRRVEINADTILQKIGVNKLRVGESEFLVGPEERERLFQQLNDLRRNAQRLAAKAETERQFNEWTKRSENMLANIGN